MILNEKLRDDVRQLYAQHVDAFKRDGADFASPEFLSDFSYEFISQESNPTKANIVSTAFKTPLRQILERNIRAFYSNSHGLDLEGYFCEAVNDFLNYIIPRAADLPDEDAIFNERYEYFDQSLYGETCLVTTFSILGNVSDNSGRVVLPDGFNLKYVGAMFTLRADNRYLRDRVVPGLEIKKSAHPIGMGREIKQEAMLFVLEHSSFLPQDGNLMAAAYRLRDEISKKFILATRLVDLSAAFSDYRGYRMVGGLAGFEMNLMNFPDDFVGLRQSSDLSEHAGLCLRRLLPRLAATKYDDIYVLDTKLDDILRRARHTMLGRETTSLKVAIEQLVDCFQILEAILEVAGSEYIALYSAVLLRESGCAQFLPVARDPYGTYKFVKRMFGVRNDIMHGRIDKVLDPRKHASFQVEVDTFRRMVYQLAALSILNTNLKETATKLAVGEQVQFETFNRMTLEETNAMRKPRPAFPSW